jgi:cytochrome c-type biogenesis protein CcmH
MAAPQTPYPKARLMGLVWLGLIALATFALLWLLRLRGPMLTLAAAAIAFGCAGYALQGRPGAEGQPRAATSRPPPVPLTGARHALMGQFDYADSWLNIADALASRSRTEDAARLLQAQVARHPQDYKLWVGLGNALADHARTLTPAARLAYARAAELAPGYPAPPFFLGLAEARSGNPEEAVRLWREILANAPADASWRPLIEDGLLMMTGGAAATPPSAPKVQAAS